MVVPSLLEQTGSRQKHVKVHGKAGHVERGYTTESHSTGKRFHCNFSRNLPLQIWLVESG
jgi:hypothetical protein